MSAFVELTYLVQRRATPFWHRDSSKLAFTSDIGGVRGIYTIKFPNELNAPKLLTKTIGLDPYWESNEIHWLVDNLPSKTKGSVLTKYTFKAYQDTDREEIPSFRLSHDLAQPPGLFL